MWSYMTGLFLFKSFETMVPIKGCILVPGQKARMSTQKKLENFIALHFITLLWNEIGISTKL